MYLQGNLQAVFDALYEMGIIEPLLEKDWKDSLTKMQQSPNDLFQILDVANRYQTDVTDLINRLKHFEDKTLDYLAMEVAREFADFHARDQVH